MKRITLPIVLLVSSFLMPLHCEASVKAHILDDCPLALEEVQGLPESEREQLLPYLLSVLKLKFSDLEESRVDLPPLPGAPFHSPYSEVMRENILMSFDPARLAAAKRCATEVTVLLYPLSLKILPQLVDLSAPEENTLVSPEHEMREALQKVILNIVGRARNDERIIEPDLLRALADRMIDRPFPTLERVLARVGPVIIPYLVPGIEENPKAADRILAVLLAVDPGGSSFRGDLLKLISSPNPEILLPTTLALSTMTDIHGQEILDALLAAARNSPTVAGELIWRVIFSISRQCRLDPLLLMREEVAFVVPLLESDTHRQGAFDLLSVTEKQSREQYHQLLLLSASPHFSSETRVAALHLLERERVQTQESLLLARLAARDIDPEVRAAGLLLLGGMRKLGDVVVQDLVKLITRNENLFQRETQEEFLSRAVESLERLPRTRSLLPALPALVDMLRWADSSLYSSLAVLLTSYPQEAKPLLVRYLGDGEDRMRGRAASILVALKPKDEASLKALVKALDDSSKEVRVTIRDYLVQLKGEIVPVLIRSLSGPDGKLRLEAAQLLLVLSPRNSAAYPAVEYGFTQGGCDQKAALSQLLVSLRSGEKARVAKELVGCLSAGGITLPTQFVTALIRLTPLKAEQLKSIENVIYYGPEDRFALRQALLEHYSLLSKDKGRTTRVATTVLKQADSLLKSSALGVLREVKELSDSTRVLLEEISFSVDRRLARDALRTLVVLDPQPRYLDQFADLLQRDGFSVPLLHHYLPKKTVSELFIHLLQKAIGEREREAVLGSLSSLGALSERRVRAALKEMLFHPQEEVRRGAAYALLVGDAPSLFGCNSMEGEFLPFCLALLCHSATGYGEAATSSWYTESVRSIVCSIEK